MKSYLDLVRDILDHGAWQDNRTGIRTCSLPGAALRFDLQAGFPAVTTKKLAFKAAIGELVGFLRGSRSAAEFRALGCKVWDQNANENAAWLANPHRLGLDDLGPVYGVQWRQWPAFKALPASAHAAIAAAQAQGYRIVGQVDAAELAAATASNVGGANQALTLPAPGESGVLLYKAVDQLRRCLDTIHQNPSDRRILFHGWNWAQLDEMALPPCHLLYQFLPNASTREISMCLYIRSNDVGLGTPFNLTEGAALLHLVGRLTGYRPKWFSYFIGDAHIYENHLPMLQEQLTREPYPAPQLHIADRVPDFAQTGVYEPEWLERVEPSDFTLLNYQHHAPLTAPMAV